MQIFSGKKHALLLDEQIAAYIKTSNYDKELLIVIVGNNPDSEKYVSLKMSYCATLGISSRLVRFSADDSLTDIVNSLHTLANDPKVGGMIIQLPLPTAAHNSLLNIIPLSKDIDMLSDLSKDTYYSGDFSKLSPVVRATKYFTENAHIVLKDLNVCIIGEGTLVGKPLSYFLKNQGANVTVINDYTSGKKLDYQLIISSAGVPGLLKSENICDGCNVIDFGSSFVNGKTIGDVDIMTNNDHLGIVSPSPGGMGPLVIRFLIMNLLGI